MELIFFPLLLLGLFMFFGLFSVLIVMGVFSAVVSQVKRQAERRMERDAQKPVPPKHEFPVAKRVAVPPVPPTLSAEQIREIAAQDQVILIRCSRCRKLNEEQDRFCGHCGASLI